jgi:hypothetical protein
LKRGKARRTLRDKRASYLGLFTLLEIELSLDESRVNELFDGYPTVFHSVPAAAIPISIPNVPQFSAADARLLESTLAHAVRFLPQSTLLGQILEIKKYVIFQAPFAK